ncbi:LysR family transcriptional regulator [Diaphorobacter sp. HDW4A]|uniref:LysR family transcriptional regulator n=1 Tax=Diaphorobacter sp. HDW4A TaxID=2714924 RepID=UPI0014085C1A|nr:LysR family transcriptional regulator [Diaphorobacter sp. HDW4A]QIL79289.1 LysR family transcriptional regulator [Diaphorobacter sp. HDW4A]
MNFDIKDMQLFLKIADTGSLTQGAKEQARSLSAASSRLKSLEGQLGTKLFYRDNNGLTLTAAGNTFRVHAANIVKEYELTRKLFSSNQSHGAGQLRVLANAASIAEIVPDILATLLKSDGEVRVDVHPRNARQAIRGVLDFESDLALITGDEDLFELNSIHFSTDYIGVIFPVGHALDRTELPRLADVVKHRQLSIYGSTLKDFISEHVEAAQLQVDFRVLLDSFDPIARLVESNAGVSIIPESVALRLCQKYRLKCLRINEPWAFRQRRAVFGELEFLSFHARQFLNILTRKYFPIETHSLGLEDMLESRSPKAP